MRNSENALSAAKEEARNSRQLQEENAKAHLRTLTDLEASLAQSRDQADAFSSQIQKSDAERTELVKALTEKDCVITELQSEIQRMRDRLSDLEKKHALLPERFTSDNLDDVEAALVANVRKAAQASLQADLVMKTNEISRRDRTINTLQDRIKTLEKALAKNIEIQEKEGQADVHVIQSEKFDSPVTSDPDADKAGPDQDKDAPSTIMDDRTDYSQGLTAIAGNFSYQNLRSGNSTAHHVHNEVTSNTHQAPLRTSFGRLAGTSDENMDAAQSSSPVKRARAEDDDADYVEPKAARKVSSFLTFLVS
ncbi:hypothetical protein SISSUDRAFT_922025 [Sistotremastrum suecicum HHB10207 ss-3]|uniref:Uncharacterized protein n=1 Tax=Sistotremastrum suecicum HHB10207 ss-3 TaxID=1314776 RepID=A0A166BX33_9AGAM|nr:hypothetical protein SISSUDRAFT_922025 [Sistotremastrum suecicum HHB10207 ss-3]